MVYPPELKNEIKTCTACGGPFQCNVADITSCQCYTVVISEKTRGYLSQAGSDCLCAACLEEINNRVNAGELE